jgi:PKD repeat protein
VFSLKVADLSTLPPNTVWPIDLTGGDGKGYIVEMATDATGTVSFKYGTLVVNPDGTYGAATIVGDADPSSAYTADGVIAIILDGAKVGSPDAGQKLTKFLVRVSVPSGLGPSPTPDNMPNDLAPQGEYTRVGNEACRPNNAPLAVLAGLPLEGDPPLHVAFDASGSKDQDGDPITSYTFRFGDGSAAVTQKTATVSHTYKAKGEYPATLTVKDARGFVSVNPAAVQVVAGENDAAASGKLPATGSSDGPTSAGHGVGSTIVAFCAVAGLAGLGMARRSRLLTRRT